MKSNLTTVLNLISRQDTYADFMSGAISRTRTLAMNLERFQQELDHRDKTCQHLIDDRSTSELEQEVRKCKAEIRLNLVQYVQTVHDITEQLEGFDPMTVLQCDVKAELA